MSIMSEMKEAGGLTEELPTWTKSKTPNSPRGGLQVLKIGKQVQHKQRVTIKHCKLRLTFCII